MTNGEHYAERLNAWDGSCASCPAYAQCKDNIPCNKNLINWVISDYTEPVPKPRTMQEIADFFGAYATKDEDGTVCVWSGSPKIGFDEWQNGNTEFLVMPSVFVSDSAEHDWKVLVTPKGGENE
jgi:hypothetical protein